MNHRQANCLRLLSPLALLMLLPASGLTQSAKLFQDLNKTARNVPVNPSTARPGSYPSRKTFLHLGNRLLLSAKSASTGQELYLTNGTKAGTQLVKDIRPGAWSSNPRNLFKSQDGKTVFFVVDGEDKKKQEELWVTDGTNRGTIHLATFGRGYSPTLRPFAQHGGSSILFTVADSKVGMEPWISNGTKAGTRLLADLVPGIGSSFPGSGLPLGQSGKTLFSAQQPAVGNELWITDGTAKGTKLVKDIRPGKDSGLPGYFARLGASKVLFTADDGKTGRELWVTDGTAKGTVQVVDINPGSSDGARSLYPLGSTGLIIFSGDNGTTGSEPYVTDGTAKGTRLLMDTWPGLRSGYWKGQTMGAQGKLMYWTSEVSSWSFRIMVSDGTPKGTKSFSTYKFGERPLSIMEMQGKVYFRGSSILPGTGYEFCVTDGTIKGTKTLVDYRLGFESSRPGSITRLNASTLLFSAWRNNEDLDLLRYIPAVPTLRIEIGVPNDAPTRSGIGIYAVPFGNRIAFIGNDGKHGDELWLGDGTVKGSRMVKDVDPGTWNGAVGTMAVLGDKIYFVGSTLLTGGELWVSDGTSKGTQIVKDIRPGTRDSKIHSMRAIGNKLYFTADDGVHGAEPWVSDGTGTGTRLLKDLGTGSFGGNPVDYAGYGNQVVFFSRSSWKRSLYLTDGSTKGTQVLYRDLMGSAIRPSYSSMVAMGGKVYFAAYSNPSGKSELWVTDFTKAGTKEVASLGDRWGSRPFDLNGGFGTVTYAGMTPNSGFEILTSDGTKAGTKLLLDLVPGKVGSIPMQLTSIGSRHHYFLSRYDGKTGLDAHRTDGTIKGTVSYDLNPGLADSSAGFAQPSYHFVPVGDKVFVSAYHAVYGRELFVISNGATAQSVGSTFGSTWMEGTDPVLGQKASLRGGTKLDNAVHVILHGIPTTKPRALGKAGWLHMDLLQYIGLTSVQTGKSYSLQIPIPSTPALKGIQLIHQSFSYDAKRFPQSLELGNGMLWTLGN